MQKDADCQSGGLVNSKGSFLPGPGPDRVDTGRAGAGEKENPINFMMSAGTGGDGGQLQPPLRKQSQLSSSHKSSNGNH